MNNSINTLSNAHLQKKKKSSGIACPKFWVGQNV